MKSTTPMVLPHAALSTSFKVFVITAINEKSTSWLLLVLYHLELLLIYPHVLHYLRYKVQRTRPDYQRWLSRNVVPEYKRYLE